MSMYASDPPVRMVRTERETGGQTATLDPDIALWPEVIVSIWPFAGPPTTGEWPTGWMSIDELGVPYVCTAGGSPGTWEPVGSGAVPAGTSVVRSATGTLAVNERTLFSSNTAGAILTLPTPSGQSTNYVKNYGPASVELGPDIFQGFDGYIVLDAGDAVALSWNAGQGEWFPLYPQQQPSQRVYLVDDYGADPTGAADSTNAIRAAKATCGSLGGGIVQLSAGATYKISGTLAVGNATQFAALAATGHTYSTASTTLVLASSASTWSPTSGTLAIFTSSLSAVDVPYSAISGVSVTVNMTGLTSGQITAINNAVAAGTAYVTIGTISTENNVVLRGGALNTHSPLGAQGYGAAATTLVWAGAAGGTMIDFLGPMTGGGVQNLYLDCNNLAGIGIYVRAAQSPVIENVAVNNYTSVGIYLTGITGFPSSQEVGTTLLGNTIFAALRNLSFTTSTTLANTEAILLDGDTGGATIGSANVTYSTIENVVCTLIDPGATFRCAGIYHRFCDNVVIRSVTCIVTTDTPIGTIASFAYDWSTTGAANCPESCILDGVNPSQNYTEGFAFYGSPSGGDPNIITNVRGGATKPTALLSPPYSNFVQWLSDTVNGNYT